MVIQGVLKIDGHCTEGKWLAPDVFVCIGLFGEGTSAFIFSDAHVKTCYEDDWRTLAAVDVNEARLRANGVEQWKLCQIRIQTLTGKKLLLTANEIATKKRDGFSWVQLGSSA